MNSRFLSKLKTPTICAALLLVVSASAATVHVDDDAAPGGNGSSWATAFNDLQDALAAGADTIWVAEGIYHPVGPNGDRAATFSLRNRLHIYGGFAGNETSLDQRDPAMHPTILSGDLNDDDGDQVLGPWANMSENSYHVVTAAGITQRAHIDGCTIKRGWSWQSSGNNSSGAGMFIDSSAVTVANCTFEGSLAHNGAGLLALKSDLTVTNCRFDGNYALGGRGGGMYVDGDWQNPGVLYPATVRECVFINNIAEVNGSGVGDAGALWCSFDVPMAIEQCTFENNQARWRFASGSSAANAGAVLIFGAGSTIDRCIFRGNRAHVAGALWVGRDTTITNCLFAKNEAFRVSSGAFDYGGYAGAIFAAGGHAEIVNSTFHVNTARSVGGVMQGLIGTATIANSVLWSNTSTEEEATLLDMQLGGDVALRFSCIRGLFVPIPGEDPPDPANFPGCIDIDPIVVDPLGSDGIAGTSDDDLRLSNVSPCIDAGSNSLIPAGIGTDLNGNDRVVDDPATPDTGSGTPPIVDMGAYEFGDIAVCPADLTGAGGAADGIVNVTDLFALLAAWNTNGPGAALAPPTNIVNVSDLFVLLSEWGACN